MANAPGQIRAKASTMADCARPDTIAVCARADAIAVWETAKENLRKGIYKGESANGERVLRTTDGRRSNVGSDCSKTNF